VIISIIRDEVCTIGQLELGWVGDWQAHGKIIQDQVWAKLQGRLALVLSALAGGVAGGTLRGVAGIVTMVGALRDDAVGARACSANAVEWVVLWRWS